MSEREALLAQAKEIQRKKLLAEAKEIKARKEKAAYETPSVADTALRGTTQGAIPFADEAYGAFKAMGHAMYDPLINAGKAVMSDKPLGEAYDEAKAGDKSFAENYREARDYARGRDAKSQLAHPGVYAGANIAGSVASSFVPGMNALGKGSLLMRGAKAGGLGAAQGLGMSDADITKGEIPEALADTGKGFAFGAATQGALDVATPVLGKVGKKALSAFGGVSEKNINRYLANPQAIRGAKTLEEIKDLADDGLGKVGLQIDEQKLLREEAQNQVGRLEGKLAEAFDNTRTKIGGKIGEAREAQRKAYLARIKELKSKSVPLDYANEFVERLSNEKANLGAMSQEADDALAKLPESFEKEHLLQLIDQVGASIGAKSKMVVGDEATEAVNNIMQLRQRIAEGGPDTIDGPALRDIMRQLRSDAARAGSFNQSAGQFNDTLSKAKKSITERVSDVLKEKSPEYRGVMERMRPLAQAVEEMDGYFGSPEKAIQSLQSIANANSPRSQVIRDVLERYAKVTKNEQLLEKLRVYSSARATLGDKAALEAIKDSLPETRDLQRAQAALAQFDPKKTAKATELMVEASPARRQLAEATEGLSKAQEEAKSFAGWTPATSENRLKQVMAGRGIQNQRSLEQLSQKTGLNFKEMLQDRATADAFEKGFMHGSRNVNLWSLIGSVFGGTALTGGEKEVARALGAGFGGVVDSAGPKMTKKALDAFLALKDSKFANVIDAAAKRGNKSLVVTHALLMKDPEYRKIMQANGEPER